MSLNGRQDDRRANSQSNKRQNPFVLTRLLFLVQKGRKYLADRFRLLPLSIVRSQNLAARTQKVT